MPGSTNFKALDTLIQDDFCVDKTYKEQMRLHGTARPDISSHETILSEQDIEQTS